MEPTPNPPLPSSNNPEPDLSASNGQSPQVYNNEKVTTPPSRNIKPEESSTPTQALLAVNNQPQDIPTPGVNRFEQPNAVQEVSANNSRAHGVNRTKLIITTIVFAVIVGLVVSIAYVINNKKGETSDRNTSNDSASTDAQGGDSNTTTESKEITYYTLGNSATEEKFDVLTATNGIKVVSTSFDYSHINGKQYTVQTKQFPTKQRIACEKMGEKFVMVIAGISFECSLAFKSQGGVVVFHNDAVGGGDTDIYFVMDATLLEVKVVLKGHTSEERDKTVLGAIVDKFEASYSPLPQDTN